MSCSIYLSPTPQRGGRAWSAAGDLLPAALHTQHKRGHAHASGWRS